MNKPLLLLILFLLTCFGCKKDENPVNSSLLPSPAGIFPPNSSTNILLKPTLVWYKSERATNYNLEISEQINFSGIVQSYSAIPDTSQTLALLFPNRLYYWRVNASDGKNISDWSSPFSFTTGSDSVVHVDIEMVYVEGGIFAMGSESGDPDEKPLHNVSLNSFSISRFEITFDQYDLFYSSTGRPKPSDNGWGRGNRPVVNVIWNDANDYCKWLSIQTGRTVRLPTEAEWEFASKGGVFNRGYLYSGGDSANEVSWNFNIALGSTHEVGTKKGNDLGLFDMSGNVWEWCSDWYDQNYYLNSSNLNPKGPALGTLKVIRGGSWASFKVPHGEGEIVLNGLRTTDRGSSSPTLTSAEFGFRPVFEEK